MTNHIKIIELSDRTLRISLVQIMPVGTIYARVVSSISIE